ncbi:MAG: hypothetical protein CL561_13000 [Alphaproteobacteria bacterium]|nr:hypothetical protein [Alphaproteobacteria bacterium]|tara:strand:- start:31703 stop:32293 length:591 start_codon:yes stop_codon:yes gene_type:complete
MSTETLLSMSEAAEMVGLTRPTFYRKVEELGISTTDKDGKKKVEVSELIRVFGSEVKMNREEVSKKSADAVQTKLPVSNDTKDLEIRIARLEADLEAEKKLRHEAKESIEYFKGQVALEKEEKNKITLLLEDHNKKQDDAQDLSKEMAALESRIANQETKAKEEQERAQKILRQNQALKKALEAEKTKSFWRKLFG